MTAVPAAPATPGFVLPPEPPQGVGLARWTVSLLAILAAHAGAVALVLALPAPAPLEPPPGAVMLELAALPEAPAESQPAETPPEPVQQQPAAPPPELELPEPEPPPEPVFELPPPPPEVVPEVAVPVPPPKVKPPKPEQPRPRPVERKRETPPTPQPPAPAAAAPPTAAPPTQAATAPAAGAAGNPAARRSWQGTLLAHLERHKRYPRTSQARREQGVTHLRFVMDREGKVLSCRIERSSGFEALDAETLEMIRRAEPLPPPPPDVGDQRIELVVPVQYYLR